MLILGVVAMTAFACVNRSLNLAPASVVVPYQYTMIVWAVALGWLVFGDVPDAFTLDRRRDHHRRRALHSVARADRGAARADRGGTAIAACGCIAASEAVEPAYAG